MPWFEVKMTSLCVAVVEAHTPSAAIEAAGQQVTDTGDYEHIESEVEHRALEGDELDSAKRHAHVVLHA
jgi:hypothetical protein